ncbi:hypothetical protein [Mesorhizobium sp. INR15]|uniref:hypothetical protein n=1 Tax=Mesorhizobium sp. INR15 TaxID=2654248 RepID=UPI001896662B|nr:hypothetical protein [Mesorhizobium sp. INR15]QPC95398.1 hypothetical protein GA829_32750 [Mesorhizobium sp. INR15]
MASNQSINLAASVEKLLGNHPGGPLSIKAAIKMLRDKTGTERSDADIEGLITKKAAACGVPIVSDREI